jgi:hypothetical protein
MRSPSIMRTRSSGAAIDGAQLSKKLRSAARLPWLSIARTS